MWDLIVSVPDHCLSFYFPFLRMTRTVRSAVNSVSMQSCIVISLLVMRTGFGI